jgi:hypothetical protein
MSFKLQDIAIIIVNYGYNTFIAQPIGQGVCVSFTKHFIVVLYFFTE